MVEWRVTMAQAMIRAVIFCRQQAAILVSAQSLHSAEALAVSTTRETVAPVAQAAAEHLQVVLVVQALQGKVSPEVTETTVVESIGAQVQRVLAVAEQAVREP